MVLSFNSLEAKSILLHNLVNIKGLFSILTGCFDKFGIGVIGDDRNG